MIPNIDNYIYDLMYVDLYTKHSWIIHPYLILNYGMLAMIGGLLALLAGLVICLCHCSIEEGNCSEVGLWMMCNIWVGGSRCCARGNCWGL